MAKSWDGWTLRARVRGMRSARETAGRHRSYGDAVRITKMSGDWYGVYSKTTKRSKPYGPPGSNPRKRKRHAKHRKNPRQLLFRTAKAARAYAKAHGAKKFSVRKLKRGK
jgi:hypothetical protein